MQQLYSFLILCYGFIIRIAAIFNHKADLWIKGRQDFWPQAEQSFSKSPFTNPKRKLAWFHCASLGEFEQGRPILENFKKQYPDFLILLTFFSPSGYTVRKDYAGADLVLYLPLDTSANARRFIELVKPDIVFWVKYEYWYNFLSYLNFKQIPVLLVSALFRPEQRFFKFYGIWSRKILKLFTRIFVQNEDSKKLLSSIGIKPVEISGDTRFDRVSAIVSSQASIEIAEAFAYKNTVLVAGSTWPADEELIFRFLKSNKHGLRLLIAPHEIHPAHIQSLLQKAGDKGVLFSKTNVNDVRFAEILIIDTMGMLSQLYRYGALAYIGGGFGAGIHNILEAAAYGLPVFFGPGYKKFKEANDLILMQGAFSVKNADEFQVLSDGLLSDDTSLSKAGVTSRNYVMNGCGATGVIMKYVNENVLSGK